MPAEIVFVTDGAPTTGGDDTVARDQAIADYEAAAGGSPYYPEDLAGNDTLKADCDLGITTQNLLLGASEKGLGGCRIASISPALRDVLQLDDHLQVLLVIALGKPVEVVSLDEQEAGGDIKYWRDADQVHHVPKRPLQEIIIAEIAG